MPIVTYRVRISLPTGAEAYITEPSSDLDVLQATANAIAALTDNETNVWVEQVSGPNED